MSPELFMQRTLELAQKGRRVVSPNPLVGCVIVQNGEIIGEGWHRAYGKAHAEVNAINAIRDKTQIKGSTVYVNLEPCSHFGKTPPCADLLIRYQPAKVVIANIDTNPLVGGKGILKLKNAGITVETGLLAEEARLLNKRFFTFIEKKRPYIILKWAETSDGFIAQTDYNSKWISNSLARTLVHKWRSEEDAIMVGTNTAKFDNPKLTVRSWTGKNPTRIVIDKNLNLPQNLDLFDKTIPTLVYNLKRNETLDNLSFVKLEKHTFLEQIFEDLYKRKIQSLIVEGGSQLLQSVIKLKLWDEARIFKSKNKAFGMGIAAPQITGQLRQVEDILDNWYLEYAV